MNPLNEFFHRVPNRTTLDSLDFKQINVITRVSIHLDIHLWTTPPFSQLHIRTRLQFVRFYALPYVGGNPRLFLFQLPLGGCQCTCFHYR